MTAYITTHEYEDNSNIMKVYNQIAEVYDYFIDWEERIKREDPFFQHLFQERLGASILDLGCGTGGHALHWSEMGYNVVGLDSARDMIEHARLLGEKRELDIEFLCLPLTDFASHLQQQFDAVVCVGNNIPHLLDRLAVQRLFTETVKAMKESGVAIFHVLNYSRILEFNKRDFPVRSMVVGGKEYVFIRFYEFHPEHWDFHFVVAVKEQGNWISHSYVMKHHPWMWDELVGMAQTAGFTQILSYGGYDFSEFNPRESNDLLLVCELGEVE